MSIDTNAFELLTWLLFAIPTMLILGYACKRFVRNRPGKHLQMPEPFCLRLVNQLLTEPVPLQGVSREHSANELIEA